MPETYQSGPPLDLTIVLPSYNEQEAIGPVIQEIRGTLRAWPGTWEILVVDDASRDETAARAEKEGARVVRRVQNGGSGASRKTGVREARGRIVAMLDADGTYDITRLPEMLACFPAWDQVNGARTSEEGTHKALRVPAKWLIRKLAEWISGREIPDPTRPQGLQARRDAALSVGDARWLLLRDVDDAGVHVQRIRGEVPRHRLPQAHWADEFHPVKDTARYATTVVRMIMYFRPLRVFLPLSVFIFAFSSLKMSYDFFLSPKHTLQESDIIIAVAGFMTLVIGLLADLVVAQRRESALSASGAPAEDPGAGTWTRCWPKSRAS